MRLSSPSLREAALLAAVLAVTAMLPAGPWSAWTAAALAAGTAAIVVQRRARRLLRQGKTECEDLARANAALRLSGAYCRALLDHAGDAIVTADVESGRVIDCNPAAECLLGLPRAAILGMHQSELHPPELRERYRHDFLARAALGSGVDEVYVQHRDGRRIPVEINNGLAYLDGRVVLTGIFRDLSERRRAEAQLRLAERVLAATTDHVSVVDADYVYVHVNPAYVRAHGIPAEAIIGRSVPSLLGEEVFESLCKPHLDNCLRGAEVRYEAWFDFRGVGKRYMAVSYLPLADAAGHVDAVAVMSRDLTEAKRAERSLRESQQNLQRLFDALDDFLFVLDSDLRILHVNAVVEHRLGCGAVDLTGKPAAHLHPPELRDQALAFLDDAVAGHARQTTLPLATRDGRAIPVEIRISRGRWSDRPVLFSVARDIGERLAAERALRVSEARYRAVVEEQSELVCRWLPDTTLTFVNTAYSRFFARPVEELVGRSFLDLIPDAQRSPIAAAVAANIGTLTPQQPEVRMEHEVLTPDGQRAWQQWVDRAIYDEQGRLVELQSVGRDITERKEAEKRLQLAAAVIENTPEGVMITDAELRILSVNPAFCRTTGYSETEALGQYPRLLRSGRHDESFYQGMWADLNGRGRWQGEIWNRRRDGEIYLEWLNINVIRDDAGRITHYVGIFSDITTQEHVKQRLHSLAYYDALTALPNRTLFHDRLEQAVQLAHRENAQVALLFLDLDRFKTINDTLGHNIGDALLKAVAERLRACVRDSDTVARLGGDEFTIILAAVRHSGDAAKVAEKAIRCLNQPLLIEGHELFVTPSIGVSLYPDDGTDPESLIKNADTAMYRAKESGRNNYQFYRATMSDRFSERLALESDLRRALQAGAISVAYQPVVALADGGIVGLEALARWHHERRGAIPPDVFIPIAEDLGLMTELGEQVLRTACGHAKALASAGFTHLKMAVNFSGCQVRQGHLTQHLEAILSELDLVPGQLLLELTESVLMDDIATTLDVLAGLRRLGVQLAVDDFGTGYSSLAYLKRFAIDKLKIDRSFVHDLGSGSEDGALVTTIIDMGHNLGLTVVAEGVENTAQLDFLRCHGCDEIQGYLFSPPVPFDEVEAMLAAGHRLELASAIHSPADTGTEISRD